jgi:hypothetical protein
MFSSSILLFRPIEPRHLWPTNNLSAQKNLRSYGGVFDESLSNAFACTARLTQGGEKRPKALLTAWWQVGS